VKPDTDAPLCLVLTSVILFLVRERRQTYETPSLQSGKVILERFLLKTMNTVNSDVKTNYYKFNSIL